MAGSSRKAENMYVIAADLTHESTAWLTAMDILQSSTLLDSLPIELTTIGSLQLVL
jgi:hypothetical protein